MIPTIIAKYIRLSVDDKQTGSTSIEGQNTMIKQYIDKHFKNQNIKVVEFVDNGHSGTSFERPAMNKMLELISKGKIDCVIVKDSSRFGRSHIEAGYLIEIVFPKNNIRFISIDDGYDSKDKHSNTTHLALKGVIHEQYAKDLSNKIKTSKHMLMKMGELNTGRLYGYTLNSQKKLEIDPQSAKVVQLIYSFFLDGKTTTQIAKELYSKSIPKPTAYLSKKECQFEDFIWDYSVIRRILENEQYIGTYIAGKTERNIVNGRSILKPKAEWVRIEGHHSAIIEPSDFEEVATLLSQRKKQKERTPRKRKILDGRVTCGICGRVLERRNNGDNYSCRFARHATSDFECDSLKIHTSILEKTVFRKIKSNVAYNIIPFGSIGSSGELDLLEQSISEQYIFKKDYYEQYLSNKISLDKFKECCVLIDETIEEVTKRKSIALLALEKSKVSMFKKKLKFTGDLLDTHVQKIAVFPDSTIEVFYKQA